MRRLHQEDSREQSAEKLDALYTECMNCPNTTQQCPGIWKDIPDGLPPRGFHYEVAPVDVLAVAKNPGHPLAWERDMYRGHTGPSLLAAYRRFQQAFYPEVEKGKGHTFHKNLFGYLGYLLDVSGWAEIYQHAAHTNLVKCSTRNKRDSLESRTVEECYRRYLRRELAIFAPKVLLALGREVAQYLHSQEWEWGIPVIYVRHPSIHYRKQEKEKELAEARRKLRHAVQLGET